MSIRITDFLNVSFLDQLIKGVFMANSNKSLGLLVLNIAMAIFLIVSGILTLQLDSSFL